MPDRVEQEIVELHRFFEAWFRGRLPQDETSLARFADALADDFVIVTPDGVAIEKTEIVDAVRTSHGVDPAAGIWIKNVVTRTRSRTIIVATYEEWQQFGADTPRGRLSTVVLENDDGAPGELRWLHVHETWLPESI